MPSLFHASGAVLGGIGEPGLTGPHHTMKAIQTKFLPATATRPCRIKAFDWDGNSVTVTTNHSLFDDEGHKRAADALCQKMGWKGPLVGGGIKNGWVFCFLEASLEVQALVDSLRTCITYVAGECEALAELGDPELEESTEITEQAHDYAHKALAPFTSKP